MKPRQTVKNYHNSNVPPYQHQQQQNSSIPTTRPRDVDLTKLVHLDDMPDLQAGQANQDDIVKCLQTIYGKNSAELLQKLPALNDWPMQSVSPPDYPRNIGGHTNINSVGLGSSGSGGTCLGSGFSNNNINKDHPNHPKSDLQFANSQHPHHQTSTINHYRVSNTSSMHSPQQQKSVLSLHQHHHQNDLSNRRLNHHHHLSSANASFVNLSSATNSPNAAAAAVAAAATSTSIPSDINNLGSGNIGPKNLGPSGAPTQVSNIMDSLGPIDNLFYDGTSMQPSNKDPSSNQQSLIRHQQLQKLLRSTGNQLKSSSSQQSATLSPSQRVFTSNNSMSHNQHPISSSQASTISPPQAASLPKSLLNLAALSTSSTTSTNSSSLPPAAKFSSMVNQLNLRSARSAIGNQANLNNSNINSSNSRSLVKGAGSNTNTNINNNNNDAFNQKGTNPLEQSVLQHATRSATSTPASNSGAGPTQRSNPKQQFQWSLLSDDQSTLSVTNRTSNNLKGMCNVVSGSASVLTTASTPTSTKTTIPASQNHTYNHRLTTNSSPKDAFLASLQEARASRAGVGEISKPVQLSNALTSISLVNNDNNTTNQPIQQQSTVIISSDQSKEDSNNMVDRNEIESALSRVEARNDLSLLYPPMLLASNSQKQINALSAGLQGAEDSELFTQEVKKIISEECNIIYECKECNNLFRSLANLVKHKRSFCTEHSSDRNIMEMNKRHYVNNNMPLAQQESINANTITGRVTVTGDEAKRNLIESDQAEFVDPSIVDNGSKESGLLSTGCASESLRCGVDRRFTSSNEVRFINGRVFRNQDKRNQDRELNVNSKLHQDACGTPSSTLTSLSRILQSQPKQRLPVSRNSALIGAIGTLNMASVSSSGITTVNSLSPHASAKNSDCTAMDVNEQLARNSSLAQTLLNEKAKGLQPRQSLIELSKVLGSKDIEHTNLRPPKRVAPKRKFLEDCIQKVKRDKLLIEGDEVNVQMMPIASNSNAATVIKSANQQDLSDKLGSEDLLRTKRDTTSKMNSPAESDTDSNVLMIDLDGPKKRDSVRRGKRRFSTAASSSASSSSSSSIKLNTSSALLRALTRPVDAKRPYNSAPMNDTPENKAQQDIDLEENTARPVDKLIEQEESNVELEVLSPLFEKYTCDICSVDYDDLSCLMNHTIRNHRTEKMVYPCIFCSFSFITLENVCRHIIDIHKKPKAQVHRLKEVVRSRSFISSDFLACSDHPPVPEDGVDEETPMNEKIALDDMDTYIKPQTDGQSRLHTDSPKTEGMRTRGKKRVDYNQMINNDNYSAGSYSSRTKKTRSKSADQPILDQDNNTEGELEKAISVDGDASDADYNVSVIQPGLSIEPSEDSERIDVCSSVKSNGTPERPSPDELSPSASSDRDKTLELRSAFARPHNPSSCTESNTKPDGDESFKEIVVDSCSNESLGRSRDDSQSPGGASHPNPDSRPSSTVTPDYDPAATTGSLNCQSPYASPSYAPAGCEGQYGDDSDESIGPDDEQAEHSDDDDSSSSSGSSTSGSSLSSSSSSPSSSSTGSRSPEYKGVIREKNEAYEAEARHSSDPSVVSSGDEDDKASEHSRDPKKNQRAQQSKSGNSEPSSRLDNDPGSVIEKRSDVSCDEHGVSNNKSSDELDKSQTGDHRKESAHRPSSVNKSTVESTPSSSSASGSGGIMKLKIQLKTRPDEKSKVYEIV